MDETTVGDAGHEIVIQHRDQGAVTVRATFPQGRFRTSVIAVRAVWVIAIAIGAGLSLLAQAGVIGWWIAGGVGFGALCVSGFVTAQFLFITRSYVIAADKAGLSIEITRGRFARKEYFVRGQLADVTLGFGRPRGNSIFNCWLVISTSYGPTLCCMHNLGGDKLARIANALREALEMPARSWP